MTLVIDDIPDRVVYEVGGTSEDTFDVPFAFFADADLAVSIDGGDNLVLNVDYTVAGAGTSDTGLRQVTLTTPISNSDILIARVLSIGRTTAFPTSGPFSIDALNLELYRIVALVQQVDSKIVRSLRVPENDAIEELGEVPAKAVRALKYLGFDADGNPTAVSGSGSATPISSVMEPVVGAASTDLALDALGGTTVGKAVFKAASAGAGRTALGGTTVGGSIFTATDAAAARTAAQIGQSPKLVGLKVIPNSGAPNDKVDVTIAHLTLLDSSGGSVSFAGQSFTIDVTQAGPVIDGRDQNSAFSSGSWIHLWGIGKTDGSACHGLASASSTAPTLPTGYSFKAYLGAVRYDGSSHLVKTSIVGCWAFYQAPADALGAATVPTSEQTLSLSAVVPPNALAVQINTVIEAQAAGGGNIDTHLFLRFITGQNFHRVKMNSGTVSLFLSASDSLRMPIVGQQIFWLYENATNVSSSAAGMWVQGYQLPNGGE